jgi:hypothetical protein
LCESGQRRDGIMFFHISTNMEMITGCQGIFQRSLKLRVVQKSDHKARLPRRSRTSSENGRLTSTPPCHWLFEPRDMEDRIAPY